MRITRVAFSFFAVGFLAGTFEQAAGLGDAQRAQRPPAILPEASLVPGRGPAAPATSPLSGELMDPADIGPGRAVRPPQVSVGQSLLDMGDAGAAEAVVAAFARVAAVPEPPLGPQPPAGAPEDTTQSSKLRPFFAPQPQGEEPLVAPEPQAATRPAEFIMPIDKGRVTSMFNQGRYHPAIDLAAPLGTPVHATTRKQRVTFAGRRGGYGNLVVTRDPSGREHYYGHLQRIVAGLGALLEQGDLLGLLGSTGHSTGPHVHYEVRSPAGRHFNPAALLFPGRSVRAGYAWNDARTPAMVAASAPSEAAPAGTRAGRASGRTATRFSAGGSTRYAHRTARRYIRTVSSRHSARKAPRYATRFAARSGQPRPR
jgi:murein DD-endopeptidase MepM/ murein hydrolase activator NlpD